MTRKINPTFWILNWSFGIDLCIFWITEVSEIMNLIKDKYRRSCLYSVRVISKLNWYQNVLKISSEFLPFNLTWLKKWIFKNLSLTCKMSKIYSYHFLHFKYCKYYKYAMNDAHFQCLQKLPGAYLSNFQYYKGRKCKFRDTRQFIGCFR